MTYREYERMTEKQLKGRKVRTKTPMRNGWGAIPEGSVAIITRKFKGLYLESDPCSHCGLRIFISRVKPFDVDLLPEEKAAA